MKKQTLIGLGFSLSLILTNAAQVWAVQPASVDQHADVSWSRVIDNPFDGRIVYDKNYTDDFAFVSVWSKQGIRATYTRYWKVVDGYKPVWRTRRVYSHHEGKYIDREYQDREPVYRQLSEDLSPREILFAIRGKVYRYEDGIVEPELANALANAPSGNMTIRVILQNGKTFETEIGSDTVEAWKTLFR
ncbi:hypothetical protein V2H45_19040 [Tumidithrix elongata RA019]|uniref:Uncharacterized protein n=1 Tax=Tumidithrix elongata BACA0141 TaxID=2716417 RepID=A0AAW9Q4M0_9CYAN|nr:hypothetical protein [Tumidithrix elongata RA019]